MGVRDFSQKEPSGVKGQVPQGGELPSLSEGLCKKRQRGNGAVWCFFHKGTNSINEALPSRPKHLPKAPSPKTSHWGLGFRHTDFEVCNSVLLLPTLTSMVWRIVLGECPGAYSWGLLVPDAKALTRP